MLDHIDNTQIDASTENFSPEVFLDSLLNPLLKLPPKQCNREVHRLGKTLGEKVNRERGPFSVSYLKGAHIGDFKIGKPLKDALLVHSITVEKGSPVKPILERVTVLAYPGCIEEGSIVKVQSRRCTECNDPFVPVVWNDKRCSRICATKGRVRRESRTFISMMKEFFK